MTTPLAFTRSAVRGALSHSDTLDEAAAKLGVERETLRLLAMKHNLGNFHRRVETGKQAPSPRKSFKDMTGQVLFDGAVTVVERRLNWGGTARWTLRFNACGHTTVIAGIALRARTTAPRCKECPRPTRVPAKPKAPPRPEGPRADHRAARSFAETVLEQGTKPMPINLARAYLELDAQLKASKLDAALAGAEAGR